MNIFISIGIDVSKAKLDVYLLKNDQTWIWFKIENNKKGFAKLLDKINKNKISKQIPIITESTWDYHLSLCLFLKEKEFENLKEINPIITKKAARHSVRKAKTDTIDAKHLAEIGSREWNSLHSFNRSKNDIVLKKKISLLSKTKKRLSSFRLSVKRHKETLSELWECVTDNECLNLLESAIASINKWIKNLEKEIKKLAKNDENHADKISEIAKQKWVSEISATIIYTYLKHLHFNKFTQCTAFFGIDPVVRSSGSSIDCKRKISKRWNNYARKALWNIAWWAVMHSDYFKDIYDYHKYRWKHHFSCLVIIWRKLLKTIYVISHKNKTYNADKVAVNWDFYKNKLLEFNKTI